MLVLTPKNYESTMISARQFSLLLVEDDEVDVMNVKRALKKNNLDIPFYRAANGLEALHLLECFELNSDQSLTNLLIFLDLNMPKMGGLEFLKLVRSNPKFKKIPVIVLTTSDQEQDLVAAYDLNVAGYIIKPVEFSNFVETINIVSQYWSVCERPKVKG